MTTDRWVPSGQEINALRMLNQSGYVRLGLEPGSGASVGSAAAGGNIRGARGNGNFALNVRADSDAGDVVLILWDSTDFSGAGRVEFGGSSCRTWIRSDGHISFRNSSGQMGTWQSGVVFEITNAPLLQFGKATASITIQQESDTTTTGTAKTTTVKAQNAPLGTGGLLTLEGGDGTTAGSVQIGASGQKFGFLDKTPIARPAITGSRGGNTALADLLTQLANLGIITDSTSA